MGRITWDRVRTAVRSRPGGRVSDPVRRAAVAMVLRDAASSLEILFIRRAEDPRDPWSGQIAFPGGRVEPEDRAHAGQTAGFYVKLINVSGSAGTVGSFKLYFTSVSRAIASCACDPNVESTLVDMFSTSTAADFAPLEAGIVDEDTYVEQRGLKWADFHWPALQYILTVVQPNTDLLFMGNPVTDEFSHQFMGLVTPTDMDGNPNPYYDDLTNDDIPDGRLAIREGYIRAAYHEADQTLALGRAHGIECDGICLI